MLCGQKRLTKAFVPGKTDAIVTDTQGVVSTKNGWYPRAKQCADVKKKANVKNEYKAFQLHGQPKTCTNFGYRIIKSAKDCKEAAKVLKDSYSGKGDWCKSHKAPDGCYWTNGMNFNTYLGPHGSTCFSKYSINPSYLRGRWNGQPLRIVCKK